MLKIILLFKEIYKLHGQITREFFGLRMQNFRGIVFIWTQRYRMIITVNMFWDFENEDLSWVLGKTLV